MSTDRTYLRDFAQKKTIAVSAAAIKAAEFDGTTQIDLVNLPENALVTRARVITTVAGNTGLTLDIKVGSTVVVNDADVDNTGVVADAGINVLTDTGAVLSVTPSVAVTAGEFVVIVEYIEYTLNTGHLTNYTN